MVGAPGDGTFGAAYVFVRGQAGWTQEAKLTPSDGASGDSFGFSTAISGDSLVLSSHGDDNARGTNAGAAYVFTRSDDGSDGDATAGDGVYSAPVTIETPGQYSIQLVASVNGTLHLATTGLAVLEEENEAHLSCGQLLLGADNTTITNILTLNPLFVAHCLLDGDATALVDAVVNEIVDQADQQLSAACEATPSTPELGTSVCSTRDAMETVCTAVPPLQLEQDCRRRVQPRNLI